MGWDDQITWGAEPEKPNKREKTDKEKDEDGNFTLSDKILKKYVDKTYQVIHRVEEIGLPKRGEQLRIITMKVFNTVSLIKLIADREVVTDAIFVIFAINQYAAKIILDLKKAGKIENAKIVVSSIRNAGHKSKSLAVDMLKEHFEVIYVNSHAKISILKTAKGNCYNVEGSGNFSFNGRIEQYIIDNDNDIFEFSKKWMTELMQFRMKTNNGVTTD